MTAIQLAPGMNYKVYCASTRQPMNALQFHVFARAYRDAWCVLHVSEPRGTHLVEGLDLLIDFTA